VQGLIIAAGAGSRLQGLFDLKPLLPVAGRAIIEHVARACALVGLQGLIVVTGHQAERLEPALIAISGRCGLPIKIVRNDAWAPGNGTSVLSAAPVLNEPFVLLMADHLFDPAILVELVAAGRRTGEADVLLAIDRRLDNPLVDQEDVTRVLCVGDRIIRLGKKLKAHNAYDCGLFWATPRLFGSLERAIESGNCSLSAGVQHVADTTARAFGVDIGARLWIDIDDDAAWRRAEAAVASGLLEHDPGTPNQIML